MRARARAQSIPLAMWLGGGGWSGAACVAALRALLAALRLPMGGAGLWLVGVLVRRASARRHARTRGRVHSSQSSTLICVRTTR